MNFVEQMKAALAKKQSSHHPDLQNQDHTDKVKPGRAPVVVNKPQKKTTGRGR